MSKRVLAIAIAALLVGGVYSVANAGVEGDFCFDFYIIPQTQIAQVTKIDLNFEGLLNLDITISGLTISTFMAFGMAGIETAVFDLETTIGFLDIYDEFWFSVPYAGDLKDTRLDDTLYFVKKRVSLTATLGGLTVNSLIIFEDLNFTYPMDPALVGTQEWAFGMCLTLSGQTVSGIGIKSLAGINCEPQIPNEIKKYVAMGTVQTTELGFTVEKIWITGIEIAGIKISNYTEFRPDQPIYNKMTFATSIMGISLSVALATTDITNIGTLAGITFTAALSDYITLTWVDKNASLAFDDDDTITVKAVFPIQTATLTATLTSRPLLGITSAKFALKLPVPVGTFTGTLTYGGSPLTWNKFDFVLASTVGGLDVTLSASFGLYGLNYADVMICVPFSA
ncbi:MAG: hypothetical protein NUW06_02995 [Candidatus Acetothermia bacterium]|jgi:hypothetical protein|nr:hypothetical protein [Candidatus Acetothermia bacterium]MDH7504840.1 hypothetical protein [Candidatus Acetothermia bacterium]